MANNKNVETATVGAGCFWGTEKYYRVNFEKLYPGSIVDVRVGYMGGSVKNPTYQQVCSGSTGMVEVAKVEFDSTKATYEQVIKFFYSFHDPTTLNRQGNDAGTQYGSVIFTYSDEQKKTATAVTNALQKLLSSNSVTYLSTPFATDKVSTVIRDAETWFDAEDYHQKYLEGNPGGYCNHRIRMKWGEPSGL